MILLAVRCSFIHIIINKYISFSHKITASSFITNMLWNFMHKTKLDFGIRNEVENKSAENQDILSLSN